MRICAVILNYFGTEDTIACALQLCAQNIDRVCVVDNSADADQAARLAAAFAGQGTLVLLETGKNIGFAAGINYGLRHLQLSDFDAVLVLNNDTLIPDGFIKNLTSAACATGLQLAAPRIQHYPDTEKLWSRGSWYNTWFGLVTHNPLPLPGNISYLTGCCLLIQCRVFETIGLFDERFFMYGEDVDFCFRAARSGLKTGVIEDAVLYHKANASSRNNSFFYEQQVARAHLHLSQCLFERRSTQTLSACVKIPILCVRALLRTLRFGNLNAIKGLLSALFQNKPQNSPCVRVK
jgi:GT2 family glycosyltransferase